MSHVTWWICLRLVLYTQTHRSMCILQHRRRTLTVCRPNCSTLHCSGKPLTGALTSAFRPSLNLKLYHWCMSFAIMRCPLRHEFGECIFICRPCVFQTAGSHFCTIDFLCWIWFRWLCVVCVRVSVFVCWIRHLDLWIVWNQVDNHYWLCVHLFQHNISSLAVVKDVKWSGDRERELVKQTKSACGIGWYKITFARQGESMSLPHPSTVPVTAICLHGDRPWLFLTCQKQWGRVWEKGRESKVLSK